jgi:hypothetical protein
MMIMSSELERIEEEVVMAHFICPGSHLEGVRKIVKY